MIVSCLALLYSRPDPIRNDSIREIRGKIYVKLNGTRDTRRRQSKLQAGRIKLSGNR